MLLCFCEVLVEGNRERNRYWMLLSLLWGFGGRQYREEFILNVTVFFMRVWGRGKQRGTDTECYCDCCEGLGEGNIERNWYWMLLCFLWGLAEGKIERNWYWMLLCLLWGSGGGECREELILNVTVLLVSVWLGQYREELILIITVFVVRVWERGI